MKTQTYLNNSNYLKRASLHSKLLTLMILFCIQYMDQTNLIFSSIKWAATGVPKNRERVKREIPTIKILLL